MDNFVQLKEMSLNGELIKISNERDDESNYYSIIVGPNGSGKSRILRKITVSFVLSNELHRSEVPQEVPSTYTVSSFLNPVIDMDFEYGDTSFYIMHSNSDEDFSFMMNYFDHKRDAFFLNVKRNNNVRVICLSNSIFNKFPKNERAPFNHVRSPYRIESYKNLSLSEDMHSFSKFNGDITDVISKEIIDLFFSPGAETNKALSFLDSFGIKGNIYISLKFHQSFNPYSENDVANRDELTERVKLYAHPYDRENVSYMNELIDTVDKAARILSESIKKNIERTHRNSHYSVESYLHGNSDICNFNLSDAPSNDTEFLKYIKKLSDNNIIKIKNLSFMKDGRPTKLYDLSSGELNVLLLLIKLTGSIENNSLILIDEPEISLHPAWQRNVIPAIERCFSQFKGCHFIIATHSPQIVSSIPEKNSSVIILGENKKTLPGYLLRGMSADHILFSTLDSPGEHNEYATRMLTTILAKLNLKKDLSAKEVLFLEKAIESYPLNNKSDEYATIKRLLKQVIGLYAV
ncbi:TPA: ATP-binding protein [Klebsiella variicola subsp. variicola]|nr:ATP-binding protein [Klebsiella variicola subsp. variicola]